MRATSVTILAVSSSDTDEPVGPAEIPEQRAYIFRDVQRCARLAGLRRAGPPSHPFNPLKALRLCAAVAEREARFSSLARC